MRLVQTSGACPEQYDVLDKNDKIVGFMHLRHGYFYASYYSDGGSNETVYSAETTGDGVFDSEERDVHLANAVSAIQRHMRMDRLLVRHHETASERLERLLAATDL